VASLTAWVTARAVGAPVADEAAVTGEAAGHIAVGRAPGPSMAERCRRPVTLDARPGLVTDAASAGVEAGYRAMGLEPPERRVAPGGVGAVTVSAARCAMTDRATTPFGPRLAVVDGQRSVAAEPHARVVEWPDHAGTRARDFVETGGRVALTAARPHVPTVWIGVTVRTADAPHRKPTIQGFFGHDLPLGDRERCGHAGWPLVAERAVGVLVRAGAGEAGHAFVIELGGALGRDVALAAVSSQFAAMDVVL
jgi:hypothetical protein